MPRRKGANRKGSGHRRSPRGRAARQGARRQSMALALAVPLALCATALVVGVRRLETWARSDERFAVRAVEVSGAEDLDSATVAAQAGIAAGMSLLDVDPKKVAQALCANPLVERVRVRRGITGRVRVQVRERTPIALVNVGQVYQVDAAGVLFSLPAGEFARLPVVSGLQDTTGVDGLARLTPSSQSRLSCVLRELDRSGPEWIHHVSQIDLSDPDAARMTLEGYPALIEIASGDMTERLDQLRRLLEVLAGEEGGRVRAIRLSHGNVAYVRRGTGR